MTTERSSHNPRIELLGIGSARHRAFQARLEEALRELKLDVPIEEVSEISDLLRYDISGIPALVVNDKVVFQKVVPSVEDFKIALSVLLQPGNGHFELQRVVVPTDFSELADNAYQFALDLARQQQATVQLIHIHQPTATVPSMPHPASEQVDLLNQKRSLMRYRLSGNSGNSRFPSPEGVPVEDLILTGSVVEELKSLSRLEQTDLIVMGTTGENRANGRLWGSISSTVARKASCPVLLVPPFVRYQGFSRIVYASNFQKGEERLWPLVMDWATRFGADVHFVHIEENELHGYSVQRTSSGHFPNAGRPLFHLATVDSSDMLDGLSQYAEEQEADLLIMATPHRRFLEDWFHRSATRRMIFNTTIPLLVMHIDG